MSPAIVKILLCLIVPLVIGLLFWYLSVGLRTLLMRFYPHNRVSLFNTTLDTLGIMFTTMIKGEYQSVSIYATRRINAI